MSTARFVVAFAGPGVVDGTIDVRDLAPALLSLGQAVDAANRAINGDAVPARVQARATSEGSFEVQLDLVLQGWAAIKGVLLSDDSTAALNLLGWLGFLGGTVGGGVVALHRWLHGRRPSKIERDGSYITITVDDEHLTVPLEVLRLYQEISVNHAIGKLLDSLENDRIDRIEFRPSPGAAPVQVLTKADKVIFDQSLPEEETVVDDTRRMALSIRSLAFQEGNKWRLYDGQNIITATIDDKNFLERVNRNEIRFAKSDILICSVQTIQRQGVDGLKTEHIVREVMEYRPAPLQIEMRDL